MYKLFSILLLISCFNVANAQSEWKLNTEKEGIKVYNSLVSDSKFKPVKVECTFNATASQLVAVLLDIKNYTDWVYHTKSATLLKQVSPSELYYYAEINIPWPAEDRDFVAHIMVTQNPETKVVTVDAPGVPGFAAEKSGIFRIHDSKGKWIIAPTGNNQIKVTYFLQVDPGGSAPAWLVNMFAAEGPLQSFKKLKLQLQKPAYKSASLAFIHN